MLSVVVVLPVAFATGPHGACWSQEPLSVGAEMAVNCPRHLFY